MPQDRPRWTQDGPSMAPRWPPETTETRQTSACVRLSFFCLCLGPQDGPRWVQNGHKMASRCPEMVLGWPERAKHIDFPLFFRRFLRSWSLRFATPLGTIRESSSERVWAFLVPFWGRPQAILAQSGGLLGLPVGSWDPVATICGSCFHFSSGFS